MVKLTISYRPQLVLKQTLILGGNEGQQVSEISGITRIGRVYKPEDLADAEERKTKKRCIGRRGKEDENISEDETIELIKMLKRS